jgi:hypothetical protein
VGKEGRITQEERLHVISLTLTIEYINLKDSILQASKVSPPKVVLFSDHKAWQQL